MVIPARDKYKSEFLFEMLFKEVLPSAHVALAITKQLHDLKQDLARILDCRAEGGCGPGSEFVMGYGEAVLSAGARYLEEKLKELNAPAQQAAE
jgi:hypothetical protein